MSQLTDVNADRPVHPKGIHAKVLLTSVFGPYAQDDIYGSRSINPMELYHNQVTRVQGPFSLRMFHRSSGLMLIQHNIAAPSTLLDFPSQERFVRELQMGDYDIVGISSIVANIGKVVQMCKLIRKHSPNSVIIVGGHVASLPDLDKRIDADHIVRGEGVCWFRHYLGQDEEAPLVHPDIMSGFGMRLFGHTFPTVPSDTAATLIPSVGCPMGCNFCATSALFGGKGHSVVFYNTGKELFDLMSGIEERVGTQSFFIMDENFLLYRDRALELLDLMKHYDKAWSLYCFSSANALRKYTWEELMGLGLSWLWMGLEGEDSEYAKLNNFNSLEYIPELQDHGVKVLGSSIIGLENHTMDNIDSVIERAVKHNTDFHQFMLYTPLPGTPLYKEQSERGTMLDNCDLADIHGQYRFNFNHPHITPEQSQELILRAFQRDFDVNGPSVFRVVNTTYKGWKNFHNCPDARVRRRLARESNSYRKYAPSALWAMERYISDSNRNVVDKMRRLRFQMRDEQNFWERAVNMTLGPVLLASIRREADRLKDGFKYEPPTIVDRMNWVNQA